MLTKDLGQAQHPQDPCMFVGEIEGERCYLDLYVDDIIQEWVFVESASFGPARGNAELDKFVNLCLRYNNIKPSFPR